MEKMPALNLEVLRFSTEDVIVTSGGGGNPGTLDTTYYAFIHGIPYYTRGTEINESFNQQKVKAGYYYFFTPKEDGNTFEYDKNDYASNINNFDTNNYYYAWYENIWYSNYDSNTSYSN